MKRIILWGVGIIVGAAVFILIGGVLFILATWDSPADNPVPSVTASMTDDNVARGEFLFKYSLTCWDCHSNESDPDAPPSGGRPFDLSNVGPGFGVYYNSNITPDARTGIGNWSDGELVRALREGVGKDGKKLFPVMPTVALNGLSDDDVLALVAYMKSIEPVSNAVADRQVSFVAKALWAFGLVKPESPITERIETPSLKDTVEYGRYVASNASLCYDCHTPRNLNDGSFYPDSAFAGSSIAFGEVEGHPFWTFAPNLTMDEETGIGSWTVDDFVKTTMYGVRPDGRVLDLHMPFSAYGKWDDTAVRAIYAYLQTLPPVKKKVPPIRYSKRIMEETGIRRGEDLFNGACKGCHGESGKGTSFTAIPLAAAAQTMSDEELTELIITGSLESGMPGFEKTYGADQVADIVAYIRTMPEPQ